MCVCVCVRVTTKVVGVDIPFIRGGMGSGQPLPVKRPRPDLREMMQVIAVKVCRFLPFCRQIWLFDRLNAKPPTIVFSVLQAAANLPHGWESEEIFAQEIVHAVYIYTDSGYSQILATGACSRCRWEQSR